MTNSNKKSWNIVDLLIVLVIVGIAFGAYTLLFSKDNSVNKETVKYDLEIKKVDKNFVDSIETGKIIRESTKGNVLGKIVKVTSVPATSLEEDLINGRYVISDVENMYDVTLSIEAQAVITAKDIIADGYDIKVGKKVFVKGIGFAATSYIINIVWNK